MVKVKERLNVNAKDFFEKIEESVVYDIEQSTGKRINPYKGYRYNKNMKNKLGRKGDVEIIITEFKSPLCYSAEFKSINGINRISYNIDEVEDSYIDVVYVEDFEGKSKTLDMNFRLMQFFYKRKAKKRASKMLKSIETYLKENNN